MWSVCPRGDHKDRAAITNCYFLLSPSLTGSGLKYRRLSVGRETTNYGPFDDVPQTLLRMGWIRESRAPRRGGSNHAIDGQDLVRCGRQRQLGSRSCTFRGGRAAAGSRSRRAAERENPAGQTRTRWTTSRGVGTLQTPAGVRAYVGRSTDVLSYFLRHP